MIVRPQFLTGRGTKGLCPPSLSTKELYQGMEGQNFFWFFHVMLSMLSNCGTIQIDGECLIEWIRSCKNKVQISRSVRMPQLHTSLHFHLTPIVMINGSSRRDLIGFSILLSLHPRGGREPVAVSAVLPEAPGKSE